MLMDRSRCCLLLVDVQEKLLGHIKGSEQIENRCEWLMKAARDLNVPVLVSEQYPQGLGPTTEKLLACLEDPVKLTKVNFSCAREEALQYFMQHHQCEQVILIGIETHVCVLQSALELLADGYHVYIVVDAVGSRSEIDKQFALQRMQQAGAQLVTAEMVVFEWLKCSGTPEFKHISKTYLQNQ